MHLTKIFQDFYRCGSLVQLMQIEHVFFLIDSLDAALQESILNICPRWNMTKIEKKRGPKLMKHPLHQALSYNRQKEIFHRKNY